MVENPTWTADDGDLVLEFPNGEQYRVSDAEWDLSGKDLVNIAQVDASQVAVDGRDVGPHLAATGNPHGTSLEQARSEDNTVEGPVDYGGSDLQGVGALDADSATVDGVQTTRDSEATFYVDQQNGDDSQDGTSAASAFASYDRALEEVPRFPRRQVSIRQIGDYTTPTASPLKITNRSGAIYQDGTFGLDIVGDSETPASDGNAPDSMETFDASIHLEGVTGVRIRYLNVNGLPWVMSSVGVSIYNCYLEGNSIYFAYLRRGDLNLVANVFDGQRNDPSAGIVALRNGRISVNAGNRVRNWDYQGNNFLWGFGGGTILDGLQDEYPDAGRSGVIIPGSGRSIAGEAFDRDLDGKPINGLREVSNAQPADLAVGEWAYDDGADAWLYKTSADELRHASFGETPVIRLQTEDTSTDINQHVLFPWESAGIIDTVAYSYTSGDRYLTVDEAGTYEVQANIGITAVSGSERRDSPNAVLFKNRTTSGGGGTHLRAAGRTGYVRNNDSHRSSSLHVSWLGDLSAGDTLSVQMFQEANDGVRPCRPEDTNMFVKRVRRP